MPLVLLARLAEMQHPADACRLLHPVKQCTQVYLARCKPLNTTVALKLVDLEELASSLDLLVKEAQTMKGLRHPNVMPLHCSFVA